MPPIMMKFVLVLSVSFICLALAQTPPKISESFLSHIEFTFSSASANVSAVGQGEWARGEEEKAEDQELEMKYTASTGSAHVNLRNVSRYDLDPPMEYLVISADGKKEPCVKTKLTDTELPSMWGWLPSANHTGSVKIKEHTVEMWNASFNGIKVAVGVEKNEKDMEVPYYLYINTSGNVSEFTFVEFRLEKPHDNHSYKIPEECETEEVVMTETDNDKKSFVSEILSNMFQFIYNLK